ncbi:hypothetical protein ILUMI_14874 [Ignelater luminosus]|uniref:Uncharacterized protein n=1 Tax=Ignelater luminosus TaxID=2038154 RepID=A0A8K0G9M7_IGNLU|nr:hypothetical protein ILUMI_14874 [Ignelater luminosus]
MTATEIETVVATGDADGTTVRCGLEEAVLHHTVTIIEDKCTKATANQQDLNKLQYAAFLKASTKPKSDLASLPPTTGDAHQHSFRVYLQLITDTAMAQQPSTLNRVGMEPRRGWIADVLLSVKDDVYVEKPEFHAPWYKWCTVTPSAR